MLSNAHIILLIFSVESAILVVFNLIALYFTIKNKSNLNRRCFNELLLQVIFSSHSLCGTMNLIYSTMILSGVKSEELKISLFLRDSVAGCAINVTFLLSLDRFLAIRKPFLYQRLGKRHASLALGVASFLVLGFCIFLYFSETVFYLSCTATVLGGFFILVSNALLYHSAKRQCEEISKTIVEQSVQIQRQKRNDMRRRKLKSLKICIYITASYFLTWCPLSVYIFLDLALKIANPQLNFLFHIIGFSNGIWDALIYYHLNRRKPRANTILSVTTMTRR